MIAHLRAIRDRIDGMGGLTAHVGSVPSGTPMPYVSLSAPGWDVDDEQEALCGPQDDLDATVRVLLTDTTESNVYIGLMRVAAELSPGRAWTSLAVAGRSAAIRWERGEFVATDRDVTIPGTNRQPGYGVDTYRVVSEPTPT